MATLCFGQLSLWEPLVWPRPREMRGAAALHPLPLPTSHTLGAVTLKEKAEEWHPYCRLPPGVRASSARLNPPAFPKTQNQLLLLPAGLFFSLSSFQQPRLGMQPLREAHISFAAPRCFFVALHNASSGGKSPPGSRIPCSGRRFGTEVPLSHLCAPRRGHRDRAVPLTQAS